MNRQNFLALAGATSVVGSVAATISADGVAAAAAKSALAVRPDFTVRIVESNVEYAPGRIVRTTTYGGIVPGPTLRMHEGVPITVDVVNQTGVLDVVHWHGQIVPPNVDGVIELGTPAVPAHGRQRYRFVPKPRGTRWYHSHVGMGPKANRGGFSGEFGFAIIEPRNDPGRYDREVLLALHEWEPRLVTSSGHDEKNLPSIARPAKGGMMGGMNGGGMMMPMLEAEYRDFSMNGRALGFGEPLRVRSGERVLLRVLNASATLSHRLALPGHRFTVVALDGNPVPNVRTVDAIELGVAERVDVIVEMDRPGVWVLGSTDADYRKRGLGIVVEYADHRGSPVWLDPSHLAPWEYQSFGKARSGGPAPDGRFELLLSQVMGTKNKWTINGHSYPDATPIMVDQGKRYRLAFRNMSMMEHPMHLH